MANKEYTHFILDGINRAFKDAGARQQIKTLSNSIGNKGNKPVNDTYILETGGWDMNTSKYSIEEEYPAAAYDVAIQPNGDVITAAQMEAWNNAGIVGCLEENAFRATRKVPLMDIPVIISAVRR